MLRNKNIKVFGHRGAAGLAFENTLEGIKRGIAEGVDGIEIDVWRTLDDEIVVFHDAYLDRLTDSSGLISNLSSSLINTIKLRNGDRIPKLIEVIELVQNKNIQLLVEIKSEEAFELTLKLLRENMNPASYIVGSFFHEGIKHCKDVNPEIQTAIMFECVPILLDEYLKKVNADYIATSIETYNQHLIATIKLQGRKLLFYTVNTTAEIELALKAGPFGIITNYPNIRDGVNAGT